MGEHCKIRIFNKMTLHSFRWLLNILLSLPAVKWPCLPFTSCQTEKGGFPYGSWQGVFTALSMSVACCFPHSPELSANHQHPPSSCTQTWPGIPRSFPNLAVLQAIILVNVANKMLAVSSLWVSNLPNENRSEVIIKNIILHISNTVKYLDGTY